jgi:hypothetical protein
MTRVLVVGGVSTGARLDLPIVTAYPPADPNGAGGSFFTRN